MSWQAIVGLALKAVVDWMLGRARDAAAERAGRDGAVATAAHETQAVVSEVADDQARAAMDGPDRADLLAAELRIRAARLAAGGGRDLGGLGR